MTGRIRRIVTTVGVALLLLGVPFSAAAQQPGLHPYAFGGLVLSWQEGATTDEHRTYLTAPGGWTAGVLAGAGVGILPRLGIEGQFRRSGVLETVEPSRHFFTYLAQRRDTAVAVAARLRMPLSPGLTLEPVGLLEFVYEQSWLASRRDGPVPEPAMPPPAPFVNSWSRGVAGGLDLRAGRGRVAFVPGVRVHWTPRGEDAVSTWPGGRSTWSLDFTASLRFGS